MFKKLRLYVYLVDNIRQGRHPNPLQKKGKWMPTSWQRWSIDLPEQERLNISFARIAEEYFKGSIQQCKSQPEPIQ